jgi:hypothetical protein
MKRTRGQIGKILERSLAVHGKPSRSEIQSVVNRVWESLPAQESVELGEQVEHSPDRATSRAWRFAVVSVVLMVLSMTLIRSIQSKYRAAEVLPLPPIDVPADANVDALLIDAVSTHISRTIPAPMEPIMALIPDRAPSGGTQ